MIQMFMKDMRIKMAELLIALLLNCQVSATSPGICATKVKSCLMNVKLTNSETGINITTKSQKQILKMCMNESLK